jgi:hypothetical protein
MMPSSTASSSTRLLHLSNLVIIVITLCYPNLTRCHPRLYNLVVVYSFVSSISLHTCHFDLIYCHMCLSSLTTVRLGRVVTPPL